MSDREYLELAAKAAGLPHKWIPMLGKMLHIIDGGNSDTWNPLTDDGDALRLAVRLGIEIYPDRECSEVITAFGVHQPKLIGLNTYEPFGNDEMAAVRRAIVRAAAEIGRSMK